MRPTKKSDTRDLYEHSPIGTISSYMLVIAKALALALYSWVQSCLVNPHQFSKVIDSLSK